MIKDNMSVCDALLSSFWTWRLNESPEFATECGVHCYDDRLDDYSLLALHNRQTAAQEFLSRCTAVLAEAKKLSKDERLSVQLLQADLNTYITGYKYKGFVFCLSYSEGIHLDFELFISWMKFVDETDYRKYIARLKCLPKRVKDTEELLRHGVTEGLTHYSKTMEGVVEGINANECAVKDTVFYEPLTRIPDTIPDNVRQELQDHAQKVITDQVQPAFKQLKEYVQNDYVCHTRPQEGVHCLPQGLDFYQECLLWHTSLPLTPQQIHDKGREEMTRIKAQMEEAMKKTGFTNFKEFIQHLREDKSFYFTSKEELLKGYEEVCQNKIRPLLTKLFHNVPKSPLIIERSPESRPDAPAGYYLAGTLDGSRPGTFFLNVMKLNMCPKYEMMTLSLHEGEPGHHFQGMYAIETEGAPKFRQFIEDMNYNVAPSRFSLHSAYNEGWGLYCEYLGNELGLYEDPYTLFGHLSFEMHRACRLVVDTGLHAMGWTFDEAVQLLMENTALAEPFIRNEVKRYICWPGQACAYKIGQLKIMELRQKCTEKIGDKFDVRDFHEEVLKSLPVPLPVLENLIDEYIERETSNQ